jgi:pimeloyl-ACP methyl ester carboxylesterase
MPTVQVQGTQLKYIEQGRGDPVVLVHGTLGDYRSWELQMQEFGETYRVISYSRRYHYPNECSGRESDYSAALHADDLASLINGLGLDSAHVVGTSYGAYTSLLLAARHPERVRALVLGDPPVLPLLKDNPEGRALRDDFLADVWEPAGEMMRRGDAEDGVRMFVDGVVEKGAFDRFPAEWQSLIMENACEFKVETSSPDFWTPFTCEDAKLIESPTLLLTGDRSRRWLQLIVDELEGCFPNSESVRVPDTTHEVTSDNPEAYNAIVLDFLVNHSA